MRADDQYAILGCDNGPFGPWAALGLEYALINPGFHDAVSICDVEHNDHSTGAIRQPVQVHVFMETMECPTREVGFDLPVKCHLFPVDGVPKIAHDQVCCGIVMTASIQLHAKRDGAIA